MRVFILVISLFLLGCSTDHDRLKGIWYFLYPVADKSDFYQKVTFTEDTLELVDEFQQIIKCPYRFSKGKIQICNKDFSYGLNQEGELVISGAHYVRQNPNPLESHLLRIDLPKLNGNIKLSEIEADYQVVCYGMKIDSSEFSMQLNDMLVKVETLPNWLDHDTNRSRVLLAIDRNSKMKDVSNILFKLRLYNVRKAVFLSGDSIDFFLKTERGLGISLPPITEEEWRVNSPSLPPILGALKLKSIIDDGNFQLIRLIHDQLFYDSVRIERDQLEYQLIERFFDKPNTLTILVYDQNSHYESYVLSLDKIYAAYTKFRNLMSEHANGIEFNKLDSISKQKFYRKYPTTFTYISVDIWDNVIKND